MSLLFDPLIKLEANGVERRVCLPELFVALLGDRVDGYPALRRHQGPSWHMFLVQLSAIAMHRAGLAEPPTDAETWRKILRAVTQEKFPDDEPWRLVVDDPAKPAFMQPPVPNGVELRKHYATPDAIDMVITAKNHDLKQSVAAQAMPDDWIFALVSLQTCEGFGGAGNYGIARMNGGSSSRVMMSLAPVTPQEGEAAALRPGRRFVRDLSVLTRHREAWLAQVAVPYDLAEGHALLWTIDWPEGQQLRLDRLDPLFIEVCRRVRLAQERETLVALAGTSSSARIDAKAVSGVLGDPWAPVHRTANKSLTLGEDGHFDYKRMNELLLGKDWALPCLAVPSPSETAPQSFVVIVEAFARGNSKTGGFRTRHLPITGVAMRALRESRDSLHTLANHQVKEIEAVQRALRIGLTVAAIGGRPLSEAEKDDYARSRPARARLDAEADRLFFPALWSRFDAAESGGYDAVIAARVDFVGDLIGIARDLLDKGVEDLPCTSIYRHRAVAQGEAAFRRTLRSEETVLGKVLEVLYPIANQEVESESDIPA